MIITEKLTKKFGDTFAVDGLTLEIKEGEVFGFLGPNGAGKTTTVRLLTTLIGPTNGTAIVNGFALGGGCELAMTCDMIVASETARFGQPEIKIGVMPGAGGTQRLTKAVGKARAMEMVLTGNFISAQEALDHGLINRVVPVELYLEEATKLALQIAEMSPVAAKLAKEAVNRAFETHLDEGLHFERKNFYLAFSSEDQKEGMQAFIEKRKPDYKGK